MGWWDASEFLQRSTRLASGKGHLPRLRRYNQAVLRGNRAASKQRPGNPAVRVIVRNAPFADHAP